MQLTAMPPHKTVRMGVYVCVCGEEALSSVV